MTNLKALLALALLAAPALVRANTLEARGACSWAGHCAGASCSTDDDCSDELVCKSGVCGDENSASASYNVKLSSPSSSKKKAHYVVVKKVIVTRTKGGNYHPVTTTKKQSTPTNVQVKYSSGSKTKKPKKTKTSSSYSKPTSSSSGKTIDGVTVTFYGWEDNTNASGDGYGGNAIAHPGLGPKGHSGATEGSGAYDDPITFAAATSMFPAGTIIYVPKVKKYYIMEDDCTECKHDANNGKTHVDLWMGPSHSTGGKVMCCENVTDGGNTIIVNPSSDLEVDTNSLYTSECAKRGLESDSSCATVNNGGEY
ncbi:hypothetical protein HDV00_005447 [Rhizophlyctis rosea]|nr:hypothetical protein HDV00_005447 [Rhizophlyctis rosea]